MTTDFNSSTLFISARSPFARRVRLAFLEHGVQFEERVLDVFKPNPELTALNPLSRVPTLRFASGQVLVESWQILAELYRTYSKSPLQPETDSDRLLSSYWTALGVGLSEKTVEYFLETLRPEAERDPVLLREMAEASQQILDRLEHLLQDRDTIIAGRLTQADLDVGAALGYLSLRYSSEWKSKYPQVARYVARLEERPSFRATCPPA